MFRPFLPILVLASIACSESTPTDGQQPSVSASIEEVNAVIGPQRAEVEAVRAKLSKATEAARAHPELIRIASAPSDPTSILLADEVPQKYDLSALWCGPATGRVGNLFNQLDRPYAIRRPYLDDLREAIPTVLAAKTALVCRTTRLDPLVIDEKAKSFRGGYFEGECRLFELEGTNYLGGFALRQGVDDKLTYGGHNPTPNTFSADLGTALSSALNTAMWGAQHPKRGLAYGCNFPDPNSPASLKRQ